MSSSIVKGMPYATMVYESLDEETKHGDRIFPTIASEIAVASNPIIDQTGELKCGTSGKTARVEREIEVLFETSDFTWLIFFSEPVYVQCVQESTGGTKLQVVGTDREKSEDAPLIIRAALYKSCSTGREPIYCHQEHMHPTALLRGQGEYGNILRNHAHLYPGPNTQFKYSVNDDDQEIKMIFDWDEQDMRHSKHSLPDTNFTAKELIGFAMPHHFDLLQDVTLNFGPEIYCASSLIGPSCLVESSKWLLVDSTPDISFRAPRPPAPWSIGALAESLRSDISFKLPSYYRRGAGDTYFSGKQLAKLARILIVAEELVEICTHPEGLVDDSMLVSYKHACHGIDMPEPDKVDTAIARLKSNVEVWLNGSAVTPFVYDPAWGGVVSCGCDFQKDSCTNRFPECPGFTDPGLNFGNAFYNDMHFHYGYFIQAAAVASHLDPSWGRDNFDRVSMLIRNIANPSADDKHFPVWRHKDWYLGHSWASGIAVTVQNGKNQESSSESIAAYEAVALYGQVMVRMFLLMQLYSRLL
jgi:hypothetical protein